MAARSALKTTLILLFTLVLSNPAFGDYRSSYSDGVKAAEKGNWDGAKAKMQEALAEQPNSQSRVRLYGMRFEPYIPHYYLALAASNLSDCATVLQALGNSSYQSAMQIAKGVEAQSENAKRMLSQCNAGPAVSSAPSGNTAPSAAKADVPQAQTVPSAAKAGVQAASTTAQTRAETAGQAVKAIAPSAPAAQTSAANVPTATRTIATPTSAATPLPAPPVARQPAPVALRKISELYFAGNLADVARFDLKQGLSGKALAHALLLRAAARHAIYLREGARDPSKLQTIDDDLRLVKTLEPSLRPSTRYFNAQFIQLYSRS